MNRKPKDSANALEVRHRAEERLRKHPPKERPTRIEADTQRLLHELQVHQIELELQNEELKETRDRTTAALVNYADLYDFAPVGYFSLDERGRILEGNLTGASLLGLERSRLLNRHLQQFVAPTSQPAFMTFLKQVFAGTGKQVCEAALLKEDGTSFWADLRATHAGFGSGPRKWCRMVVSDITNRKQAEEALRWSEALLSKSQAIAHVGSWELDLVANRLSWSDEVHRIFGQHPQEFAATYEAFLAIVHPDDRAAVDAAYSGSLREGRDSYEIEHRIVRHDSGEVRVVLEKCEHVKNAAGRIVRSLGMVQDITERKEAEEAQRRTERQLAEQQVMAERARIARDLHDDLGNRLSEIQILAERIAAGQTVGAKESALAGRVSQRAVAAVEALEELIWLVSQKYDTWQSLARRLEREVRSYLASAGIAHDFVAPASAGGAVEPGLRQTMLMALREMLHNAVVHGRPQRISVRAVRRGGQFSLSVTDNGQGFNSRAALSQGRGLAGLKARSQEHGGTLQIRSKPGRTKVSVSFRRLRKRTAAPRSIQRDVRQGTQLHPTSP